MAITPRAEDSVERAEEEVMIPVLGIRRQGALFSQKDRVITFEIRLKMLNYTRAHQSRVQYAYIKRAKPKPFSVRDLMLKLTLSISKKCRSQGDRVVNGNPYYYFGRIGKQ